MRTTLSIVSILLLTTASAARADLVFVDVANDTNTLLSNNLFDAPALNENNELAFRATAPSSTTGSQVYRATTSSLTRLIYSFGPGFVLSNRSNPSINDSGAITYTALRSNTTIFDFNYVIITTAASGTPLSTYTAGINGASISQRALANDGDFIFNDSQGVKVKRVSQPVQSVGGTASIGGVISDGSAIAYVRGRNAMYRSDLTGGPVNIYGSPTNDPISISMNNDGALLLATEILSTSEIVLLFGEEPLPLVELLPGYFSSISAVSLNDDNDIAVLGIHSGSLGIYAKSVDSAVPLEVIRVGDSLFGSTVTSLSMSIDSINDSDWIAFQYELANGIEGVALVSVPEIPAIWLSLATLATSTSLGLLRNRLRRRVS